MLFSLANIPAIFQSYVYKCLAEKQDVLYIMYLNDIFIYTSKKGVKYKRAIR